MVPARADQRKSQDEHGRAGPGGHLPHRLDRSDEVVLADPEGNIIKAYQIRRKPEGQRWCADRVIGIKATTVQPTPGSNDLRIRTSINIERDTETKVQAPVPRGEERAPHRVRLMKYDFIQFGYTTGCPGCRALTQGRPAENHTEPCRSRMGPSRTRSAASSGSSGPKSGQSVHSKLRCPPWGSSRKFRRAVQQQYHLRRLRRE